MEPGQGEGEAEPKPQEAPIPEKSLAGPRIEKPASSPEKPPIGIRTLNILKKLWGIMDASGGKPEQFDKPTTARLIVNNIISGVGGEGRIIKTSTVLAEGGRLGGFTGKKYFENHPEEYRRVNRELANMAHDGILEMVELKGPTPSGDIIGYKVKDLKRLEDAAKIAKGK